MRPFKKVLVFGGTHGNEWTGIKIIEHYSETLKQKYPDLDLEFVFANPEAYAINRRFKDEDLNRAFQFLNEDRASYEHQRAKEIKSLIDQQACFVIDLHTTTSSMGKTVIVMDYNPVNLQISSSLSKKFADCRIIGSPDPTKKYLASQSSYGFIVEVGPVPNGVVEPVVLEGTLSLLDETLFLLQNTDFNTGGNVEIYEEIQDIYYPKNSEGKISGYIHPDLQGKDFSPVNGEFNLFKTFEGKTIKGTTSEEMFPIFINEAAYYPQNLALTLCRKRVLNY